MPLCRNLKIWVTFYERLQELCHLNPLKQKKNNMTSSKTKTLGFLKINLQKMKQNVTHMSDMSLEFFQSKGS